MKREIHKRNQRELCIFGSSQRPGELRMNLPESERLVVAHYHKQEHGSSVHCEAITLTTRRGDHYIVEWILLNSMYISNYLSVKSPSLWRWAALLRLLITSVRRWYHVCLHQRYKGMLFHRGMNVTESRNSKRCRFFSTDFREQVTSWESLCTAQLCRHPTDPRTYSTNDACHNVWGWQWRWTPIRFCSYLTTMNALERAFETSCGVTDRNHFCNTRRRSHALPCATRLSISPDREKTKKRLMFYASGSITSFKIHRTH